MPRLALIPRVPLRSQSRITSYNVCYTKLLRAGVGFTGSMETGYRACLWSRLASRILLTLVSFQAESYEALYSGVQILDWREHLAEGGTLAVDATCLQSPLPHSQYAALKVKDAIVDQLRDLRNNFV